MDTHIPTKTPDPVRVALLSGVMSALVCLPLATPLLAEETVLRVTLGERTIEGLALSWNQQRVYLLARDGQVLDFPPADAKKRIRVLLKNLGLEHKLHAKPLQLSGGEQQRVAIARAIINDPVILLADEPTGNLDSDNTQLVMDILNDVHARGTTVMVATHDVQLIEKYPRRVIHLEQGRLVKS